MLHSPRVGAQVKGKKAPGTLIHEAEYQNEVFTKAGKNFSDIYRTFIAAAGRASSLVRVASIAVAGLTARRHDP